MTTETLHMSDDEQKAVICICVLAAFADGTQSDVERARIERIASDFSNEHLDLGAAYQQALTGQASLPDLVARLQTPNGKALAYEMAACVCNADGVSSAAEQQFLSGLQQALRLDSGSAAAIHDTASALAIEPLSTPPPLPSAAAADIESDRMIVNYAILNGALELMPHSLATMAIVPLQMRMVYRIGKSHGYDLDRGHIKDFLATVGIGLTSQVVEGYVRRLIGGLARQAAGGLLGGLVGQAAGSGFAFATTYALGQVAKRYYASGRTLDSNQLKEVFRSMVNEGRSLQARHAGDIAQKSREVNVTELLPLIRQH